MLLRGGQVNAFDGKRLEMMGRKNNVSIQGFPQYFLVAVVVALHHAVSRCAVGRDLANGVRCQADSEASVSAFHVPYSLCRRFKSIAIVEIKMTILSCPTGHLSAHLRVWLDEMNMRSTLTFLSFKVTNPLLIRKNRLPWDSLVKASSFWGRVLKRPANKRASFRRIMYHALIFQPIQIHF